MSKPSSYNLSALPNIEDLQKLCKALSALDAIICPEWEYRYYSYQKDWNKALGEACMQMRDGSGDEFFVLFTKDGAIINGQARESEMCHWEDVEIRSNSFFDMWFDEKRTEHVQTIWEGVVDNVPNEFKHFIFGEPVQSIGTTFCIWRKHSDSHWQVGDINYPDDDYKDGSEDLLYILDNKPNTYRDFALDYFETEFEREEERLSINPIIHIYNQNPVTKDIVQQLNPNLKNFNKLKVDLDEIGYPYVF